MINPSMHPWLFPSGPAGWRRGGEREQSGGFRRLAATGQKLASAALLVNKAKTKR